MRILRGFLPFVAFVGRRWFAVRVLASLALKNPFTLQYAREETPQALWTNPVFIALNVRTTWAGRSRSIWIDVTLAVGSLAGAALFTTQEAKRARARVPA